MIFDFSYLNRWQHPDLRVKPLSEKLQLKYQKRLHELARIERNAMKWRDSTYQAWADFNSFAIAIAGQNFPKRVFILNNLGGILEVDTQRLLPIKYDHYSEFDIGLVRCLSAKIKICTDDNIEPIYCEDIDLIGFWLAQCTGVTKVLEETSDHLEEEYSKELLAA